MTNAKKEQVVIYKSFEQFKAELFPQVSDRQKIAAMKDVGELAVCMAQSSFNRVVSQHIKP